MNWLKLERQALGELPEASEGAVELGLARLRADKRELPPLDLSREDSGLPLPPLPARPIWRRPVVVVGAVALLLAAGLGLFVLPAGVPGQGGLPGFKGGEPTLSLERQRDGSLDARDFRPGDRFQARLSCPPGDHDWTLRAEQDGQIELLGSGRLSCSNGLKLPAGWTVDGGGPVRICLRLDQDEPLCQELQPLQ